MVLDSSCPLELFEELLKNNSAQNPPQILWSNLYGLGSRWIFFRAPDVLMWSHGSELLLLRAVLLKCEYASESPGSLLKLSGLCLTLKVSDSVGQKLGPNICISNKISGDPENTFWEPSFWRNGETDQDYIASARIWEKIDFYWVRSSLQFLELKNVMLMPSQAYHRRYQLFQAYRVRGCDSLSVKPFFKTCYSVLWDNELYWNQFFILWEHWDNILKRNLILK